jgi:hypothetical protein
MSRTKQLGIFLIVAVALPLLAFGEAMASGGGNPGIPTGVLRLSKDVTALIVLDPNGPVSDFLPSPITPTGTFGTITVSRKHYPDATAVFQVQSGGTLGELSHGCDPIYTNARFVDLTPGNPGLQLGSATASNWLAPAVTEALFNQIGVPPADSLSRPIIPAITGVISQHCAPFPSSYPSTSPGFLILEVNIGFWAAPGTPTPH